MKIPDRKAREIKKRWDKMASKEDFVDVVNFAKQLLFPQTNYLISLRQLNYHALQRKNKSRYRSFTIAKRNGGERKILAPNPSLKIIQKCLNIIFQAIYDPHKAAMGFVSDRSIIQHAQKHIGSNYILTIDLKDFFHSIEQARIWGRLQHPPFTLSEKNGRIEIAKLIAALCCHPVGIEWERQDHTPANFPVNVLPQGAPTSPTLSNAICEKLDIRLTGASKRFGFRYSRYADDLTFSAMHSVFPGDGDAVKEIRRIIVEEGFLINESKVRVQKQGYRQEVTGLVVNEKVNVRAHEIKNIRKWLHYSEMYGLKRAQDFFEKDLAERGSLKAQNLMDFLRGKINFIQQVKGGDNATSRKLMARLEAVRVIASKANAYFSEEKFNSFDAGQAKAKKRVSLVHDPKRLVQILYLFSSGPTLKYATHAWDSGGASGQFSSYVQFINRILKGEKKEIGELRALNDRIHAKVKAFVLTKNTSGFYLNDGDISPKRFYWNAKGVRIDFGWRSQELAEWAKAHPMEDPFDFRLPRDREIRVHRKDVQYFRPLVSR
jgi:RNA-directed DNA polymerase